MSDLPDDGSLTIPSWALTWGGGVLALLLGSGGLAAWFKQHADSRAGVASQELAEDEQISQNWQKIIAVQTEALIKPLREELSEVKTELATVKADLDQRQKKYWSAISYIRHLLLWINRHMPDDVEATVLPAPPAALVEDL